MSASRHTGRYTDWALYRRLLWQARDYWPQIAGVFLLSLLATPLALLTPLPLRIAVDSVLGSHPLPGFLSAILPEWLPRSGVAVLAVTAALVVSIAALSQLRALA